MNKNYTDDKEEILNFLGLNGSAILLPYVRAIVSMLTTLDSNQAIVLPTINVMDLLNQE
ncbi:protein-export chaperone SecB [Enterococcus faecalis]|nr:protein-export chaperone SecB [Enterococcus faecalis]